MQSQSDIRTPLSSNSVGVGSNSVGSNSVGSNSVGSNSVGSNSVGSNSVGSNSVCNSVNFVLPTSNYKNLDQGFRPAYAATPSESITLSPSLHHYLNLLKDLIDPRGEENWDKAKKSTNPYEYVHSPVSHNQPPVCALKPLSRSFYKMIELSYVLYPTGLSGSGAPMKTFHLAEGPGGFIEAVAFLRKNPADLYYGMTLLEPHNHNVPGWHKSKQFLEQHPNVFIESGSDGSGDLTHAENLQHCYQKYGGTMDLVTADGGFDYSPNYTSQEPVSTHLIFSQIAFALALQKKKGHFILKVFDTFTQITLDLLFLLTNLYEQVQVVKPQSSRAANSEKYVVCKHFKLEADQAGPLVKEMHAIMETLSPTCFLQTLWAFPLPYMFLSQMEQGNALMGQGQVDNILLTLALLDGHAYDKHELSKTQNVLRSVNFCQNYKLPCHPSYGTQNIFRAQTVSTFSAVKADAQRTWRAT